MGLVARGTRDLGDGQEPVKDDLLQDRLESRARWLQGYALSIGSILTVIVFLLPHPFP